MFNRYVWLVDIIYRAGRVTFEEINKGWMRSQLNESGEELPLRTFHNHRKAIEQMFDINIECDRKGGYVYYIEDTEDMERGGVRQWLLNTFAVNNLINESHHIKHRILFEEIPSGQKYLTPIIEAMRNNITLELTYQNYWGKKPYTYEIAPYCVKVFKQRWYMVACSITDEKVRIYGLDRIHDLCPTGNEFKMLDSFNPRNYFNDSFGIIVDEEYKIEHVKIRAIEGQQNYVRSLPLHHSQEETEATHDYSIFEYYLRPTFDFKQELLSHGPWVEVLSPEWLRSDIAKYVADMERLYHNTLTNH